MKIVIGDATLYLARAEEMVDIIGPVDALVIDPNYKMRTSGGGKFRKVRPGMDRIAARGLDQGFDVNIIRPEYYKSVVSFCHNYQLHVLLPFFAKHYHRHALLAWEKTNPMPVANRNYQATIEPYIHAWQQGAHPLGALTDLKRTVTTTNGKSKYDHPTVKPDVVMNKIITNVNAQTVLDIYMGTGSTGIAALRQGKKFIGVERDESAFQIACSRFFELYSVEMANTVGR